MRLLEAPQAVTPLALFRFRVVSEVLTRVARGEVRAMAVRRTARLAHIDPDGAPRAVSVRSVYRWLAAYEARGIAGLRNQPRPIASDGVLEPALVAFLVDRKAEDPRASVPQLLKLAVEVGLLRDASDAGPRSAFSKLDVDLLRLTAGLRVAASRLPSLLSPSWARSCESGAGCTSSQELNGNPPRSAASGGSGSSSVRAGGERDEEPVSRWCTRCARRPRSRGPAQAPSGCCGRVSADMTCRHSARS